MDGRVRLPRALRFLSAAILLVAASFALLTCNSGLAVGLQQKIDSEEPSDPEPPIDPETQAPVEVDVVERDFYSLVLSWEPSNDDHLAQDRLQYLAGYSLDIEDVTGAAVESATLILDWTEGATTATMTGLTYGQTYHANVAVRDLAGHIAYYTPTPVRTREDEDPPVQGGDLAGSLETTTGFTVSWTAASDPNDLTAAEDLMYKVVYLDTYLDPASIVTVEEAEANGTVAQDWTKNITSAQIDGLVDWRTHDVAVLVRDDEGLKETYGVVEVSTLKQPRLFFSEFVPAGSRIRVTDLTATTVDTVITMTETDMSVIIAMAVDPIERKIYWADRDYGDTSSVPGAILRCDFDGGNFEELITENLPDPQGIAIDYEGPERFLYWTDLDNDSIYQSPVPPPTTDAVDYVILNASNGVDQPRGIGVSTDTGKIHWLQLAGTRYLGEAEVADPTNTIRNMVTTGEGETGGMAIDTELDLIYWTSDASTELRVRGYGDAFQSITTLVDQNLTYPFGVAVDPETGDVFWIDRIRAELYRRPIGSSETDAGELMIRDSLTAPYAVAIY